MSIKGFIFDLDGVIVFTDQFHYQAWKYMSDKLGIYFDETINNRLRGVSRAESLEIILERYEGVPLSAEQKAELMETKNAYYRELLAAMTPEDVTPEVRETLLKLKADGYKLAIGSSSKNAGFILGKVELLDVFDAISDGNNITYSKPDPEVFTKAGEYIGTSPGQCIVVEDAYAGIDAAKAAGMAAVAIGDAASYEKADYHIKSFQELIKIAKEQSLIDLFGTYSAWKIDGTTWVISFMDGTEYMYLLEGDEKALLIDTGYGTGNLRLFVETLTNKHIIVANTHFHPDHAAGNAEFESACMSKGAVLDAPSVLLPGSVPFDLTALPFKDYERSYVGDGDTIELGNRIVEVIDTKPAHCNSSLFFLDRGHRMFFCGDELESAQVLMFDNSKNKEATYDVKERLLNMRSNSTGIKELADEYDYLLPNHNGTPIAKSYAEDYIGLVDAIFAGTAVIENRLNHPFIEMDPIAPALCRVRYRLASIFIVKEQLMTVYGKGK